MKLLRHLITFTNEITVNKRTCCTLCTGKAWPWSHFTGMRTDHPGPPPPRSPRSAAAAQKRKTLPNEEAKQSFLPAEPSLPGPVPAPVPGGPVPGDAPRPRHPRTRARRRAYATWFAMPSGAGSARVGIRGGSSTRDVGGACAGRRGRGAAWVGLAPYSWDVGGACAGRTGRGGAGRGWGLRSA